MASTSSGTGSRLLKGAMFLAVLGGLGYGIFYYGNDLRANRGGDSGGGADAPLVAGDLLVASVERKPFEVVLNVQGHLDSQSNATLTNQVEGSSTIISIIPEGTWVEKGDIVCELDSSQLSEQLKQQQIDVTQAESKLTQASEAYEIQQKQNESDIAAAKLAYDLAKLDLVKYEDGEFPALQRQLEGVVAIELEEYRRAEEDYDFTQRLVRKGYETPSELESKRIALKRENLELQKAREDLKVLTVYTKKRDIEELRANVSEFDRELTRVELKAKSALAQAKAEVDAAKLTLEVEREKLVRNKEQLAACTLRATQAGEVVYANLQASRRGGSDGAAIEEGATVRERQAIINLPDVTKMKVDCRIHESLISQINTGLSAGIRVDAYPDEVFGGVVSQVSSVPMSGSWPNYDLREYETVIQLTDDVEKVRKLRPGLTAQVEIIVDRRKDVLQVPQQAVVRAGRQVLAFVVESGDFVKPRILTLGMTNSTSAEVLDGLEDGERVVLNPRQRFAEKISELTRLDQAEAGETKSGGDSNADDVSRSGGGDDVGRSDGKPSGPRGPGGPAAGRPGGQGLGGAGSGSGARQEPPGGGAKRPGGPGQNGAANAGPKRQPGGAAQ